MRRALAIISSLVLLSSGCGDAGISPPSTHAAFPAVTTTSTVASAEALPATTEETWVEVDLSFTSGGGDLHGVLALPGSTGPHPAVVMPFESVGTGGGLPPGVASTYQTDLARRLAAAGYAAFRYDPPGVGESGGEPGFPSLQARADETIAALHRVQQHPAVRSDQVGLWGISQEAWVISLAAADHPDDIAFMIAVSGSGVSVAAQQVWGIETQSESAGLEPGDVERAGMLGRLLIDWQLTEPIYRDVNRQTVQALGAGPWQDLLGLVYEPQSVSPADDVSRMIEILTSVQDEPWAAALYLDTVTIPALRRIPADQIDAVRGAAEHSLLFDPRDSLTKVTIPVLAFFGEDDLIQPSERSADLYARYLEQAQNEHVTIVTLPHVGHDILLSTPGYWERLIEWLDGLHGR